MRMSEVHAAESVAYLNRALVRLQELWDEIGFPEKKRSERTNTVHQCIRKLLDEMIVEEEEHRKHVMESIESNRKELHQLCSELQMPPFEEEEEAENGFTVLQLEKNIRTRVEMMTKRKMQRMDDLKSLAVQDRDLCDSMDSTPFGIDLESVPTPRQLDEYRAHVHFLTKEKERRREEFVGVKKEIIACMDDLEREAKTDFEKDVMYEDEKVFLLSTDNIDALKLLLSQLQQCKAEKEVLCAALRAKTRELWDRLKIPLEEREKLSAHIIGFKKRNIEALHAEVERLELLRRESMKSIIDDIRAEIALYWEACFYSQEQRQAFLPYHDDDMTEELLNQHEAEVKTLKSYFDDHKELFEGVRKWQEYWDVYLELDRKASDMSRLNNRGGTLLKEAKQRSDLQKSLPKLEKTLKAQIDFWEHEQGKKFFVNGQKFLDYVTQQWERHHAEKEQEKMERQLKKNQQTKEDMLYGTAVRTASKRHAVGTPTPSKQRKMGISTISKPTSILGSALGGTMCQSSVQKLPPSASKSGGLRTPGHAKTPQATERNKENLNRIPPCGTLRGSCRRLLNQM
ncbi:protein regulator of cytokinesis 1-like isoform X2 [Vanacampus margaritifer]